MDTANWPKWIDSLERYVFVYYGHLLTEAERHAWQYFIQTDKRTLLEADPAHKQTVDDPWKVVAQDHAELAQQEKLAASRDPVIKKLIDDFPDQFYTAVTYRILRDHADEVQLTLCPKCLNLCGTPQAQLCLRCGHSWHSEKD